MLDGPGPHESSFSCRYFSEFCEMSVGVTNRGWALLHPWSRFDGEDTLLQSAAVAAADALWSSLGTGPTSSRMGLALEGLVALHIISFPD